MTEELDMLEKNAKRLGQIDGFLIAVEILDSMQHEIEELPPSDINYALVTILETAATRILKKGKE
jgi:hypothetical protein